MSKTESNAATRRSHAIVELLAKRFFDGMSNKELAEALKTSPVNISRDLGTLEDLGYVRKQDNGRWGLTTKPLMIMQSFTTHYQTLQTRMAETSRNIFAGSTGL